MAWTKRPENRCKNCGYTWFPKGKSLSRQCPNCGGRNVGISGCGCSGCGGGLLTLIVLLALFGAINHKDTPATESPSAAPLVQAPPEPQFSVPTTLPSQPLAATTSSPTRSTMRAPTVAEAQREAIKQHPELGVANSSFNSAFVRRYNHYKAEQPSYLNDPSWPIHLADEIATMPATPATTYGSESFLGVTEAEIVRRLGRPLSKETDPSPDGPFTMLKYGGAPGRETFFVIFASDGTVSSGQYQGIALRSR